MDSNEWVYHLHFRSCEESDAELLNWREICSCGQVQWQEILVVFAGSAGGCMKAPLGVRGLRFLDEARQVPSEESLIESPKKDGRWNKVRKQKCGTNTQLCKPYGFNWGRKNIRCFPGWGSLSLSLKGPLVSGGWNFLLTSRGSIYLILASGALAFMFCLWPFL